jgi:hypothetical protein
MLVLEPAVLFCVVVCANVATKLNPIVKAINRYRIFLSIKYNYAFQLEFVLPKLALKVYLMFRCSLTDSIMYLAIDHFHSAYKPIINPNIK